MQPCLLILGMHRSGTSALAGSVQLLGAELGSPLMPTSSDNEKGFFEHLEVRDLHRRLLGDLGRTWHDLRRLSPEQLPAKAVRDFLRDAGELLERNFGDAPLWSIKDPRLCRLLPVWLEVLKEVKRSPRCVIIYRHPREVADSLASRDGFSAEKSALLWADHNLAAERESRNLPRIFLDYRALLQDPAGCLTDVSEKLDISWPVPPSRAEKDLAEFLSTGRQHHRNRKNAKAFTLGRMSNSARALYAALETANRQDGAAQRSEFEQACRSFEEVYDTFDPLLMEQAGQSSPTLAEITELRGTLVDRTVWLRLQAGEIERQQQSLVSLRGDLDSIREVVDWQGNSLVSLRDDLDSIREVVDWQGNSLVSLRSALGAVKAALAEQERKSALGEMIWESKPWRLYLWLGRAARAMARRLRLR